jgi:GTP-binding protein
MNDHPVRQATFLKSGTRPEHYPTSTLPEVAFAGRSNAGKSSLLNTLMQRKDLVRVSNTPGRTQILSWFEVNRGILLCDLPGYGFAKVPAAIRRGWQPMVGTYLSRRDNLRALVIITDVRRGFEADDMQLVATCLQLGQHCVLVATKCDKLSKAELFRRQQAIGRDMQVDPLRDILWFSAATGAGRADLWRRLDHLTGAGLWP